ncbi:MAG: 16S rRNA (cytidine(1402)-2'-O)-methyltransferase [Melioribacteraceae bacterium]|nr:16S rRNA (cytidine(1402)-2'-O)-methyltransferase [Melioribacteraceae bacterium]
MVTSGKIYVVSTPIGNLGDMTYRAVETLKSVNFILCEDTRVTKILLDHYEIKGELISFNAATESKKMEYAVDKILNGANCALVSDAGTPTISDPGGRFINLALKNDIEVVSVPGASAIISALSISGLPTDAFVFEGFLPQKKGRQKKLVELAQEERTIVLYESVYRITNLLEELKQYMPERMVVVFRELTKKFEERWKGYPQDLLAELESKVIKGEFVVVIAPLNWKEGTK